MTLLDALKAGRTLLADGATGTMLQAVGLSFGKAPDYWNLDNPGAVREVARCYTEAGADLIYTNTFGSNRLRLKPGGGDRQMEDLNRFGVRLARGGIASAETRAGSLYISPYIIGSIGPTGELLEPYGDLQPETAFEAFAQQARVLADEGVDGFVCETFTDLREVVICIEAVKSATSVPVIASLSFEASGRTMMGVTPAQGVSELLKAGAVVAGANCSIGPEVVEAVLLAMKESQPHALLLAKPNAGIPHLNNFKPIYPVTPRQMGDFAYRMIEERVAIIGGCCGTTPEHITVMRQVLNRQNGADNRLV